LKKKIFGFNITYRIPRIVYTYRITYRVYVAYITIRNIKPLIIFLQITDF